jgi:hypothetical protein
MKTSRISHSFAFHLLEIGSMTLFLSSSFAAAPREERALWARNRYERNKAEVQAWAQTRNIKARHDDGRRVMEIMAIRQGRPFIYITQNDDAAVSTAADKVRNTSPYNLNGSDVLVGIWDGGAVMSTHQEFGTRVISVDGASANYHATHVGGTIGATGIAARAEGMAPKVKIRSYDWNADDAEMISAAMSSPGEAGKIVLSNHSYGILAGWFFAYFTNPWTHRSGYHWWGDLRTDLADEYFGQYGWGPRDWDQVVYDAPYFLPFKAAGNERDDDPVDGATVYFTTDNGTTWTNTVYDSTVHALGDGLYKNGYDTIPYLGTAKNIMTVGAVYDAEVGGVRELSNATFTGFSSWGPADDGRIKPDIVANGDGLYSCHNTSPSSYATRSGTSMSSPNACGSAALLVDYYDDLHPGEAMRASTLKGLIIHTSDDLGRPGPDYQYGWGLVNTLKAAELLKDYAEGNLIRLSEEALSSNNTFRTYICFADGGESLRATLCWTDPPGTATGSHDSRTAILVNDLDIKVTGPGGTFYPYRLSYSDPDAHAVNDGENNIDNVEQVLIETPQTGTYTITVDYDGVLEGGEQYYSLLTSGVVSDQDGDGLPDYWEAGYFFSTTGGLASADADGDGYDNLSEYIAGSSPVDANSVFRFTSEYILPATGHPPYVVEWNSIPGRVYNVYWTYNLIYVPPLKISDEIPWPANSYTDSVDRLGNQSFYRIDVRMDQ